MIRDWKINNAPNYDDLVIDRIEYDKDDQKWAAIAHDDDATYTLNDYEGDIYINYLGSR